ncbi:MAG: hypothetical protein BGN97_16810 [Microbacterium sp. 69-10]|uniref:hypothetical protein n=1 Tax=Microbacterium sp. 69-10 TaxID=1895783 RepID=UPI000959C4B3|nr:hypothetical protein [Microbacterium sp. 69-10]OJU40845.1 MAG: hypothetical protein BGN97_16810 [Microbacterium sp. 69-10]
MITSNRRLRDRSSSLAAGTVLVTLVLTGCGTTQEKKITLPPQNIGAWSLPLDEFTYTASPLRDYAEALLEKPCYEQHGVEWPVPWRPVDVGLGASYSAGLQRIFNADLAAKFGYHAAPNDYEGIAEWKSFVRKTSAIAEKTPGFDQIMDACQSASREALPLPADDDMDYALSAASVINTEALASAPVISAGQAWASCMAGRGYAGLSPEPQEAPGDALQEQWKVGYPGTMPGRDEIAMATADAACLEEGGWSEKLYREVWRRQADFVEKNADRLVRIRQEFADDRERLLGAVAQNAPGE